MKKKLLAVLLAATMALSITACGGSSEPKEEEKTTEETEQTKQKEDESEEADVITGKVDSISIDNEEGTLTYTNHELSSDYEGNPVIIVYFDYTNKKDETSYAQMTFYPQAFQNGVECDMGILMDENEGVSNSSKEITTGTTLNVAFVYELQDNTSPVTMKVTDQSEKNLIKGYYQEQELAIQ